MKNLWILAILVLLILCFPHVSNATWQASIEFDQALPDPNDLAKWELWYSDQETGIYVKFADVLFEAGKTVHIVSDAHFGPPDSAVMVWYWKMRACDAAGNISAWSNIVPMDLIPPDTEAPEAPVIIGIIVEHIE